MPTEATNISATMIQFCSASALSGSILRWGAMNAINKLCVQCEQDDVFACELTTKEAAVSMDLTHTCQNVKKITALKHINLSRGL